MERTCATEGCGNTIPPQKGRARPRKFCEECRPPKNRPNPRVITLPEAAGEPVEESPGLVASYRAQLEAADRLDSPEGALVMHLARLFEAGQHTASGAASLSRELRAAMEEALKGAPAKADSLDELAARRQAKVSGA